MNADQAGYYGNRLLDFYCRARSAHDTFAAQIFDREWTALWADIFYQYKHR